MKAAKIDAVIKAMEEIAPIVLAESWDNVGLQIGFRKKDVDKVLLSLDVDESIIKEAIRLNAGLIVSHHPLIFSALRNIDSDDPIGSTIMTAVKNEISVFCAHTNLDKAKKGVNDALAEALGLTKTRPLITETDKFVKLIVFVPLDYIEIVKKALGDAGAGKIGNYSHCSFETRGRGAFKPLVGADPTIGKVGELTDVDEARLEVIVNKNDLSEALRSMLYVHPYEDVAYDVYPLNNEDAETGIGRVGELDKAVKLSDFAELCSRRLKVRPRIVGSAGAIKKVAVCGGNGGTMIEAAIKSGAQILVTGDIKYHQAKLAKDLGFCVFDCDHDATEKVVLDSLKSRLSKKVKGTEFVISKVDTAPWRNNV